MADPGGGRIGRGPPFFRTILIFSGIFFFFFFFACHPGGRSGRRTVPLPNNVNVGPKNSGGKMCRSPPPPHWATFSGLAGNLDSQPPLFTNPGSATGNKTFSTHISSRILLIDIMSEFLSERVRYSDFSPLQILGKSLSLLKENETLIFSVIVLIKSWTMIILVQKSCLHNDCKRNQSRTKILYYAVVCFNRRPPFSHNLPRHRRIAT